MTSGASRRQASGLAPAAVIVAILTLLSGCGGGSGSGSGQTRTVTVVIADGKLAGDAPELSIGKGTRVELDVTSDTPGTVHVHGIDQRVPLRTGAVTRVAFVASVAGSWDVEVEETGLLLTKLEVSS